MFLWDKKYKNIYSVFSTLTTKFLFCTYTCQTILSHLRLRKQQQQQQYDNANVSNRAHDGPRLCSFQIYDRDGVRGYGGHRMGGFFKCRRITFHRHPFPSVHHPIISTRRRVYRHVKYISECGRGSKMRLKTRSVFLSPLSPFCIREKKSIDVHYFFYE